MNANMQVWLSCPHHVYSPGYATGTHQPICSSVLNPLTLGCGQYLRARSCSVQHIPQALLSHMGLFLPSNHPAHPHPSHITHITRTFFTSPQRPATSVPIRSPCAPHLPMHHPRVLQNICVTSSWPCSSAPSLNPAKPSPLYVFMARE